MICFTFFSITHFLDVLNLPVLHTIFSMSTLIQNCDVVLMLIQGLLGPGCLVYYCDSKPVL